MRKLFLSTLVLSSLLSAELLEENFGEKKTVSLTPELTSKNPLELSTSKLELPSLSEINATIKDVPTISVSELDDEEAMGNTESIPKIKLKSYDKVKYASDMDKFIPNHPGQTKEKMQKSFKLYLESREIDEFVFKKMLDSDESLESIKVSAFYYDWYLQNPKLAENFYKMMFKRKASLKLYEKYILSDYLVRTGRGDMIHSFLKKAECSVIFKGRGTCYYYLGLDIYLNTGDRSNNFLRMARKKHELAGKLYKAK